MRNDLYTSTYNPDVLSCIANLSNDEVFTPPEVANAMLDLLPQELFRDPNAKFLEKTLSTLIQRPVSFESGLNWFQPCASFESGFTFAQ